MNTAHTTRHLTLHTGLTPLQRSYTQIESSVRLSSDEVEMKSSQPQPEMETKSIVATTSGVSGPPKFGTDTGEVKERESTQSLCLGIGTSEPSRDHDMNGGEQSAAQSSTAISPSVDVVKDANAKVSKAEGINDVASLKATPIGTRVLLTLNGLVNGGLIAAHADIYGTRSCILIALDLCGWHETSHEEAISSHHIKIGEGNDLKVNGKTSKFGVLALSYSDGSEPAVCGMLVGIQNEQIFKQTKHPEQLYTAHYARPHTDIQTGVVSYTETTFCIGDVVGWKGDKCTKFRAAVVRLVYKARVRAAEGVKGEQARRLMVLCRIENEGTNPKETTLVKGEHLFFPASWGNWERIPQFKEGWLGKDRNDSEAEALQLLPEQIASVNKVYVFANT